MPTCLFTGVALGPETRIEHTIPRSLGGRIRSRTVSSDAFNNGTAVGYDDLLLEAYAATFNYLDPLLSREHAQGQLRLRIGGEEQPLHPGGELGLGGMRVEQRDERGRPAAILHEDPDAVRRFAERAGWEDYEETHEIANVRREGQRRVPVLSPPMEVAALKCALLALDHVLGDDVNRFTRNPWLSTTRNQIAAIVMNDANPYPLVERVTWGLQYEATDDLQALRAQIGFERTQFEHLLVASGNPESGTVDVAWLLGGIDPWTFRLTRMWDGPAFTIVSGCGVLRGTHAWPAVVLDRCEWELGARSERRSVHRANVPQDHLHGIMREISGHRLQGYRRAVDLIERQCDDVVRGGILAMSRFPEAEPPADAGDTSVRSGFERRLQRLFWERLQAEGARGILEGAILGAVAGLPAGVQAQRVERADTVGDGVDWGAWIAAHRRVLDAVARPFGLPGELRNHGYEVEPGRR